jgi:signal transduction histidine kinase
MLRTRTAVIITLFIWFTAISIGWVCRNSFRLWMSSQTDTELAEDANEFHRLMDGEAFPWNRVRSERWNRRVVIHPLHRLFIRVQAVDGTVLWESITAPMGLKDLDPNSPSIQSSDSYRVIHRPVQLWQSSGEPDSDLQPQPIAAILQVGCSVAAVADAMGQVDAWLLPALVLLFFGTPPVATLLATWLLKPLHQLTQETDSIQVNSDRLVTRSGNGDEIDRLAETVNSLLARARADAHQNEAWIADSAHQLRSPLAAIISNVEVVANRFPEGKSGQMLEKVLSECQFLGKLVNQLLLLAETNAERRQPMLQPVRWDTLVARSSDFFEALASEKGIQIEASRIEPCTVLANPEHLRFVIHNLIDNAIKYTSHGGFIEISVERMLGQNRSRMKVADTGIGISPEDQERIGRRFFRINSGRDPSQTPRGTGLGLSIVKNIIETVGGTFELQSELGRGTVVTVELPEPPVQSAPLETQ